MKIESFDSFWFCFDLTHPSYWPTTAATLQDWGRSVWMGVFLGECAEAWWSTCHLANRFYIQKFDLNRFYRYSGKTWQVVLPREELASYLFGWHHCILDSSSMLSKLRPDNVQPGGRGKREHGDLAETWLIQEARMMLHGHLHSAQTPVHQVCQEAKDTTPEPRQEMPARSVSPQRSQVGSMDHLTPPGL